MVTDPLARARQLAEALLAELASAGGPGAADDELLGLLSVCEVLTRGAERVSVGAIADLERRGVFAERGYRSTVTALADLLGWERGDARRRLVVAEQACPRVALDGTVLPARLAATAVVFAAGDCSARQVEVVARVLGSDAARRLSPQVWGSAEQQLAAKAGDYSPADLLSWGAALVEILDQDGPEPDDRPPAPGVNELFLTRNPSGSGGKIKGRFDDPALFDAIATVVDAGARPTDAADAQERPLGRRQAEALADACDYVLDHADAEVLPASGGERPHLSVVVRLEDLENRARAACLDLGGPLTPEGLRLLACDARVVPVVLGGQAAARRRPRHPGRPGRATPRSRRPRPRLRPLRAPTVVVRDPPPDTVGTRRHHRDRQPRHGLPRLSRAPRGAVCSERRWKDSVCDLSQWVVEAEGSLIREVPESGGKQP